MCLTENLQLPVPDIFLQSKPDLQVAPELFLINLEKLQQQLTAGDLDPAEYLAAQELATYRQFKYQKRQIEWLGGRLAAKQAVLRLKGQRQTASAMRDWPIFADEHGKPLFNPQTTARLGLSISHSHGLALAMAVNEYDCGLDIQQISSATVRVKEKFCTLPEEQIIAALNLPDTHQETGLTLLWAAKEALRKARGGHPLTGFTTMQLTETGWANNSCWLLKMRVEGELHQIPSFFYKNFAIALCVV